jgi:hypothetical protein
MKTFTKTTSLLLIAIIFSVHALANITVEETESYINDIPFNTNKIAEKTLYENAISVEFYLEDEEYVDDIPFNTKKIADSCLCEYAMNEEFHIEQENYIDDIPFNTLKIAIAYSTKLAIFIANYSVLSR